MNNQTMQDLQNVSVSTMSLKDREISELVELAAAKKRKMDLAKAELDVVSAEIQNRAIAFQDNRHIKFTEWHGTGRALASVTVAQNMDILNYYKLKELLGPELIADKVKIKSQDVKYDIEASFKRALTAIILDDYEKDLTMEEVVDRSGWCDEDPEAKKSLLKKLKGDYKKDKKTVLDMLNLQDGDLDLDTELYLIYQIRNWQLIRAYFDESRLDEVIDAVKRCVIVDETAKISLRVG